MSSTEAQALGYEALGEYGIPRRRYFRKHDRQGTRTHNVYGFLVGSDEAKRHLAFRAYMAANPSEAHAYGALKERLASVHSARAIHATKHDSAGEHRAAPQTRGARARVVAEHSAHGWRKPCADASWSALDGKLIGHTGGPKGACR